MMDEKSMVAPIFTTGIDPPKLNSILVDRETIVESAAEEILKLLVEYTGFN
jgi:hypothetical protein